MVRFDCVVDTTPMANSLDEVSHHVNGTTAAVIGMKAAVIEAEETAATHVCNNVNKGFYMLLHSQISQKIAKLSSDVDSHLMKLNQMRKQLLAIKTRMQKDYGMISQRYIKLFNGLNSNLERRIYEIDRPVMEFAMKDVATVSNRMKALSAVVPVSQVESLEISQKMIASNIKHQGGRVITSMHKFLEQVQEQSELTEKIILPLPMQGANENYMVPVLISETSSENGVPDKQVAVPAEGLSQKSQDSISYVAIDSIESFNWVSKGIDDKVKNEFNKLVVEWEASDRVKQLAGKLFAASDCKTI